MIEKKKDGSIEVGDLKITPHYVPYCRFFGFATFRVGNIAFTTLSINELRELRTVINSVILNMTFKQEDK